MDETDILPCPFCGQPPYVEMTGHAYPVDTHTYPC